MSWPGWCPRPEATRWPCGNVSGCSAGRNGRALHPCLRCSLFPSACGRCTPASSATCHPARGGPPYCARRAATRRRRRWSRRWPPRASTPARAWPSAGEVLVAQGGVLSFRHPLLRSATWERASVSERVSAHGSLAGVISDRAARAWHRAEATRARTQHSRRSWPRSPMWIVHAGGSAPRRGRWHVRPGSAPILCSGLTGWPRRRRTRSLPVTPTVLDGWRPRCSAPTRLRTPERAPWSCWACSSGPMAPLRTPASSSSRQPGWPPGVCSSGRLASCSTPAICSMTPKA